ADPEPMPSVTAIVIWSGEPPFVDFALRMHQIMFGIWLELIVAHMLTSRLFNTENQSP
ncbi:3402_t:CDS:1, partial [Funneliformis mosseae]